jgi:hypothetical protein
MVSIFSKRPAGVAKFEHRMHRRILDRRSPSRRTKAPHYVLGRRTSEASNRVMRCGREQPYCLGFSWSCTLALLVPCGYHSPLHDPFDYHVTVGKGSHHLHGGYARA